MLRIYLITKMFAPNKIALVLTIKFSDKRMNILSEFKTSFRYGGVLNKLVYINVGIFVLAWLTNSFAPKVIEYFMLPAEGMRFLLQPWSIISYMFLHVEFMHILFNMLWLYWFGQLFVAFINQKQLLNVYLVGGISGGLLYMLIYNLVPTLQVSGSLALGASASVMAVVLAVAFYKPNQTMLLMFFGEIKIIYIALVAIGLDMLFIFSGENVGGHIAHLGGATLGWFYAINYRKGRNILLGFERFMDSFFSLFGKNIASSSKKRTNMTINYGGKASNMPEGKRAEVDEISYNARKKAQQDKIDKILEKISKSGYDSLTSEEKEILFKESNKLK